MKRRATGSIEQTPNSYKDADRGSNRLLVLTIVALTCAAAAGTGLWFVALGALERAGAAAALDRDDADAVAATFGPADDDRIPGDPQDTMASTRVLTYAGRGVRVVFVRRSIGSPPAPRWKLVGFTDLTGWYVLTGEEALRRLKVKPHDSVKSK